MEHLPAISIEPIAERHIAGFRSCLDEVAREGWLVFREAPSPEVVRDYILNNIRHDVPQFVAVSDDIVAGWCDVTPKEFPGFTHCARLGMGLRKAFRRRGIGTALIEACFIKARQQGVERVELEVYSFNEGAIALYTRLGFAKEGLHRHARKRADGYDDILQMARFF